MPESRDGGLGLSIRPDQWARRRFMAALTGGLLAAPLAAEAQPIPKVGLLGDASWEPLRQGLRELGYVEGKTLILELRRSEGRAARLPDLAHELVRVNVHVIVSEGTPATFAAKRATATVCSHSSGLTWSPRDGSNGASTSRTSIRLASDRSATQACSRPVLPYPPPPNITRFGGG